MSPRRLPHLDHLIGALTAESRPKELAGRDAALAAFRAANQPGRPAAGTARRHRVPPVGRVLAALSARMVAVGAALVIAAGVAAAAYAQVLPVPVQRLAHTVFAPLGVPNGQQPGQPAPATSPGPQPTGVTIATSGGQAPQATCPCPGPAATTPSPSASPSAQTTHEYLITVSVSRVRVPAGTAVAFTGRVTDAGHAVAGVRVRLFGRIAGTAAEQLAATGVTGPLGGFRLVSPPLTATAVFRVTGPDAAHSVAVRITVSAPGTRTRLP